MTTTLAQPTLSPAGAPSALAPAANALRGELGLVAIAIRRAVIAGARELADALESGLPHSPGSDREIDPDDDGSELVATYGGVLVVLPKPLRLRHGPLPVTIALWSDRVYAAKLPAARLAGQGRHDADALADLSEVLAETFLILEKFAASAALVGPALEQWAALSTLVERTP